MDTHIFINYQYIPDPVSSLPLLIPFPDYYKKNPRYHKAWYHFINNLFSIYF